MGKSVPINSLNAIDAVAFVVVFDKQFTEEEVDKLSSLETLLKLELPKFDTETTTAFFGQGTQIVKQTQKKSGVSLKEFKTNGNLSWSLRVNENQIIVSCNDYNRWKDVSEKAERFITEVVGLLDLSNKEIQFCVLQYIDRFVGDESSYKPEDVFTKSSPFLTAHSAKAGTLWHVHQGWFEELTAKERILNVLNISTNKEKDTIITTIDHSAHYQYLNGKAAKSFFSKKEYVKLFNDLHERNKKAIDQLLNDKQKKAIKLNG